MYDVVIALIAITLLCGLIWHNQPARAWKSNPKVDEQEYEARANRAAN